MVESRPVDYLHKAHSAMSRGDYFGALQFGIKAADVPPGQEQVRCDAYMLLALTSLQIGMTDDALAFAVGAHLTACWSHDMDREEKASSIVAVVVAAQSENQESIAKTNLH